MKRWLTFAHVPNEHGVVTRGTRLVRVPPLWNEGMPSVCGESPQRAQLLSIMYTVLPGAVRPGR